MIADFETYTLHKRTEILTSMVEQYKRDIKQLKRDVEDLRQLVANLYKEKALLKWELKRLKKNY